MKLLISFLFLIKFSTVYSQDKIKGMVVQRSNEPVVGALLFIEDTNYETSTDSLGIFKFTTTEMVGETVLIIVYENEILLKKNIFIDEREVDLGKLIVNNLQPETLSEITIYKNKEVFSQEVDRISLSMSELNSLSHENVFESIKRIPGILIQGYEILSLGKGNVSIHVDNRLVNLSGDALMNFLTSINSSDVEKIEFISIPPSEYDANSSGGVVNIILKKRNIQTWNNSVRSNYSKGRYSNYNIGNTFNYNSYKFRFTGSFDIKRGFQSSESLAIIQFQDQKWEHKNQSKIGLDNLSSRLSVDYELNSKHSIGLQYINFHNTPTILDRNNSKIISNEDIEMVSIGRTKRDRSSHQLNFNYLYKIDSLGRIITSDFDYLSFRENQNRFFNNLNEFSVNDIYSAITNNNQDIQNISFKIDAVFPLKIGTLNFGGKTTFTEIYNNIDIDFNNSSINQHDSFKYKENISSLYLDLNKSLTSKVKMKFGLRYENTQTNGESIANNQKHLNNYGKIFPSLHFLYNVDSNNTYSLGYSKRIRRPLFWELNPFRWYNNSISYTEGNPFLTPSFSNNLEFSKNYKNKIITTLYANLITDGTSQIPNVQEEGKTQVYTRYNYFKTDIYGASINYILNKSWIQSYNYLSFFYNNSKITKEIPILIDPKNGFSGRFSTNNTIFLSNVKQIYAELNFWYSFPSKTLLYDNSDYYNMDISIRKVFSKPNIELALSVYDIFRSSFPENRTFTNNIDQRYKVYNDSRFFRIALKYNFGNKNIKESNRNTGNDSEAKRI